MLSIHTTFSLDFIGIGAPRCGTTWLSACLAEHPQICFSKQKDLHYFQFDARYKKGISYLLQNFDHYEDGQITGKWSVQYLYSDEARQRIYRDNANVKLLVSLRNPVDRAFSHFLLRKYSGKIAPYRSFTKAIGEADRYHYFREGCYAEYLQPYLKTFGRDRVYILIYEEMIQNPQKTIEDLCRFLDIETSFQPSSLSKVVDYRAKGKYHSLYLQSTINKLGAFSVAQPLKPVFKTVKKLNRRDNPVYFEKPALDTHVKEILHTRYEPEIQKLEELLDRPLDCWRDDTM